MMMKAKEFHPNTDVGWRGPLVAEIAHPNNVTPGINAQSPGDDNFDDFGDHYYHYYD